MAFKMSPIGKKKCPYSPMQKRGLLNPSPAMNNGDDEKNQKKAQDNANKNVKWNEPGEWVVDPSNPNREMRTTTGDGTGEYYVGKKKMDPKKWAEWLKTPAGKRYTALKNVKKVEYRDINKPKSEIKAKAEPVDKNIGTKLITERIIDPNAPKRYDGRLDEYVPNYIEVQRRVAVSTSADDKPNKDLDQNVTYSTTGDKDEVKNALDIDLTETQQGLENIRNEEVTVKSGGG